MTERISIVGLPGLLESTTLGQYYEIFGTVDINLYADLEEIISWVTLADLYALVDTLNHVTLDGPVLEMDPVSPHELSAMSRLIDAAAMSTDPYSLTWLKAFIINIIHSSREDMSDGFHFLMMSADLGAVVVKTNQIQTVYEAHRTRLGRLRWKFSTAVRRDLPDQCLS